MRIIDQFQFDFTFPDSHSCPLRGLPASWQVRHLSRRYRLPESQARLCAGLLDLPVEARHD